MTLTRSTVLDHQVRDRRLPGHSFLDAIHNRQLMSWSDRGGASQHIGEQWALRCTSILQSQVGGVHEYSAIGAVRVASLIRLDTQPGIERDANRHQLENPDFFVLGTRELDGRPVVFASDAKFAADRIKPSQVSAETTRQLLEIPDSGTARALLDSAITESGLDEPEIIDGLFLVPDGSMTELLLARRNGRSYENFSEAGLIRLPPEPATLFAGLPMASMIASLARVDGLPVSPRKSLLSAVYYFRVACACHFLWTEENRPLLTNEHVEPAVASEIIAADVAQRLIGAQSAFELLQDWNRDLRHINRTRRAIKEAARLPISMREIRDVVDSIPTADSKAVVKWVRRDLEIAFREQLVELIGEIPANDPRPSHQITREIGKVARDMRRDMLRLLDERVAHYSSGLRDEASSI